MHRHVYRSEDQLEELPVQRMKRYSHDVANFIQGTHGRPLLGLALEYVVMAAGQPVLLQLLGTHWISDSLPTWVKAYQ